MTRSFVQAATVIVLLLPSLVQGQVILGPSGPVVPEQEKRKLLKQARNEPQVFQLKVDPAAEPDPALKYSLMPAYLEQTCGNAVPYYYRAILAYRDGAKDLQKEFWDKYGEWMDAPSTELPKEQVSELLNKFTTMFAELKTAAYREKCDWDWRIRDLNGPEAFAFLMSELQESRSVARMVALKARLQIADRHFDEAIATLRLGYKLAQDVAEPPTLINDLVGIAIAGIMNVQLLALIDAPGAPNMYWAVAELPDPLVDMRLSLQQELTMPARIFPFLKNAESANRSADEWRAILVRTLREVTKIGAGSSPLANDTPPWLAEVAVTGLVAVGYPRAKRELIADGHTREQVEKMSPAQVVAIHSSRVYRHIYDEMFKWSLLPYTEGLAGFDRSEEKLEEEGYLGRRGPGRDVFAYMIASLLLPATSAAKHAEVRLRTQIAGLRTLEAIRMHAAAHNGQLPKSLSDITVIPTPDDPATGKPFAYRLEGDRATLDVPDRRTQRGSWRIEITINPRAK